MIDARPTTPGEWQAARDRLREHEKVGLDVEVLHGEHPAGSPEPRLHLVGDEDDPVLVADRAQAGDELDGRREKASLALLRLEDDRRDVVGRDMRREHPPQSRERRLAVRPPVSVGERSAIYLRRERSEPRLVRMGARGHRQRHPGSAVEGALERDDRLPLRVQTRELDRVLDRLGARVEERGAGLAGDRHERPESLRERRRSPRTGRPCSPCAGSARPARRSPRRPVGGCDRRSRRRRRRRSRRTCCRRRR